MSDYVLYTQEHCIGSRSCARPSGVVEQRVEDLKNERVPIPKWLAGTPLLLHVPSGNTWQGKHAVAKTQVLAQQTRVASKEEGRRAVQVDSEPEPKDEEEKGKVTDSDLQEYMKSRQNFESPLQE